MTKKKTDTPPMTKDVRRAIEELSRDLRANKFVKGEMQFTDITNRDYFLKAFGDKIAQSLRDMTVNIGLMTGAEQKRARELQQAVAKQADLLGIGYEENSLAGTKVEILKEEQHAEAHDERDDEAEFFQSSLLGFVYYQRGGVGYCRREQYQKNEPRLPVHIEEIARRKEHHAPRLVREQIEHQRDNREKGEKDERIEYHPFFLPNTKN